LHKEEDYSGLGGSVGRIIVGSGAVGEDDGAMGCSGKAAGVGKGVTANGEVPITGSLLKVAAGGATSDLLRRSLSQIPPPSNRIIIIIPSKTKIIELLLDLVAASLKLTSLF